MFVKLYIAMAITIITLAITPPVDNYYLAGNMLIDFEYGFTNACILVNYVEG